MAGTIPPERKRPNRPAEGQTIGEVLDLAFNVERQNIKEWRDRVGEMMAVIRNERDEARRTENHPFDEK